MKDIIVITGASSGMGKEFARQIVKKEKVDELWIIARRQDRLEDLAKELPVNVKVLPLDLSKEESFIYYRNLLFDQKPNIRILANCAGYGKLNHYENEHLNTYFNMIDLNIKAVVAMINESLPYLHPGSKIMNLDSCSAFQPIPYINVYAASKAFVLSYSRALNQELKYRRIHVLAVCPYWVDTEFFNRAIDDEQEPVVINYGVIYQSDKVIKKAIKDLYSKKDVSIYGLVNKLQVFGVKVLPHKMVMKIWMNRQKLDGTPKMRKS